MTSQETIYWTLSPAPPPSAGFLSPGEAQKLASLRFEKRRREWQLGRWTAKRLLAAVDLDCAKLALAEISIENEPGGAPFISIQKQGLYPGCLSIGHREDLAFCAITTVPGLMIGADLEWIEPRTDRFVQDYLTEGEARQARMLNGGERDRWVALAWSAKESVLKALRIGLRVDTRAVELLSVGQPGGDGWSILEIQSSLPGTSQGKSWARQEGNALLVLSALSENSPELVQVKPG